MSDLFQDLPPMVVIQLSMFKRIVILIILKLMFIKGREGFGNPKHLIAHFPVEKAWASSYQDLGNLNSCRLKRTLHNYPTRD